MRKHFRRPALAALFRRAAPFLVPPPAPAAYGAVGSIPFGMSIQIVSYAVEGLVQLILLLRNVLL